MFAESLPQRGHVTEIISNLGLCIFAYAKYELGSIRRPTNDTRGTKL